MVLKDTFRQESGNTLGYTFLALMFLSGLLCAVTFRHPNRNVGLLVRWDTVLISVPIIVIAGWGFGLDFIPGALLVLVAALIT